MRFLKNWMNSRWEMFVAGVRFHLSYGKRLTVWAFRETIEHVGWNMPTLIVTLLSYPVALAVRYIVQGHDAAVREVGTMFDLISREGVATIISLFALGLVVFLFNLLRAPANLQAEAENDRDGLKRDLDRIAEKQSAVDRLSRFLSEGITFIWNRPVRSEADFHGLDMYWRVWHGQIIAHLQTHFNQADVDHFNRLGVIPKVERGNTFNNAHRTMLMHYALQEQRLREIIRDHNVTRVYIQYTPMLVAGRR